MCGIVGFVGDGNEKTLRDMAETIRHRGPDDRGLFCKDGVGLAHTRLSILDLSPRGHQPMWNKDENLAIIFNGEIYNFKELKEEFGLEKKYHFQSGTDTEVILHLYEELGEQCFEKLDGMFAVALFDVEKGKLVLARDRMGEKPLYWGVFGETLVFGSELNALLAHGATKRELDMGALARYLVREYVPTPYTIFKGIFKLEPAHYLVYEKGAVVKTVFWSLPTSVKAVPFQEAVTNLDQVIEKSVRERLVADVPVGIFLSGGIDSSTVAYYAQKASGGKAKTFSIGFDEASYDESPYAKRVAGVLATDHHHKTVKARDALETVNELASITGEPHADPSIIPTLLLSKFTRGEVTVALGGDGMDELLAGYPTFQADKLAALYNRLPLLLRRKIIEPVINALPASDTNFNLAFRLQKFIEGAAFGRAERHGRWLQAFSKEELKDLLLKDVYKEIADVAPYEDGGTSPQDTLNSYLRSYLMDGVLVKLDRASMHYALEARVPYLGREVVEFLTTLPYGYKLHGFTTKYLLKELMKDKLPKDVVYRKKKGFGIPVSEWLKKELKPLLLQQLAPEKLRAEGIFNPEYVARLIEDHMSGTKNNRKKLWALLMFELWAGKYLV